VAVNGAGLSYAATVTTGVSPGNALGNIPMNPVIGPNTTEGYIVGAVTTAGGDSATSADITLSALQSIGNIQITVPLAQEASATATLATISDASCPINTDCASYTLDLPGVNPTVGAFNPAGTSYSNGAPGSAIYTVEAQAFVPGSGGTQDCSPPVISTPAQTVSPGSTTKAPTLAFTGCQ